MSRPHLAHAALTLSLTALTALSACGGEENNASDAPVETSTRISVEGYSLVRTARFSPDGTRLVMFAEKDADTTHMITTNLEGGDVKVHVTEGLDYLSSAAWFPDGEQLAYTGDGGLHRIGLEEGAEPKKIVEAFAAFGVDVSPDGSEVTWTINGQQKVNKATVGEEPIQTFEATYGPEGSVPRFSPDGSTVFFMAGGGFETPSKFYTIAATLEGDPEEVAEGGDYLSNGAWIDDNTVLVIIGDGISKLDLTTRETTQIEDAFAAMEIDVSADGTKYIYGINGQRSLILDDLE